MAIDQTKPTPAPRQRYYIGTDAADHPVVRRVAVPARERIQATASPPVVPAHRVDPVIDRSIPAPPVVQITSARPRRRAGFRLHIHPINPRRLLTAVRHHRADD